MREFYRLSLVIVLLFSLTLPAIASTPQYAVPLEVNKMSQIPLYYNAELKGNTPYFVTIDHSDADFGNAGSWNVITILRQYDINGVKQDIIINRSKVNPGLAADLAMNFSGANPMDYEYLSVNGIPWQIFDAPEYDDRPQVGDYRNVPGRKTASQEINWYMTNPERRYTNIRPVLPTGSGKMISVYDESTIVALYTSSTVDAKYLLGRPFTQNGRLMIPVTGVVDYLGADVSWDNQSKSTVIKQSGKEIRLQNGSTTAYINGMAVSMEVAPVIVDGRTFIPLRFVSDTLGFKVKWQGDINAVVRRADIYN